MDVRYLKGACMDDQRCLRHADGATLMSGPPVLVQRIGCSGNMSRPADGKGSAQS